MDILLYTVGLSGYHDRIHYCDSLQVFVVHWTIQIVILL